MGLSHSGFDALTDALEGLSGLDSGTTFVVGTDVDYSVYVELGTVNMEAQPYIRPAVERVAANPGNYVSSFNSIDEIAQQIAEGIAEEARSEAPVDTGRLRDSIRVVQQ